MEKFKGLMRQHSLKDLCDNIQWTNILIVGAQKEKRENGIGLIQKIMAANFPNLQKEIDIQNQESQTVPNKINPRRPILRHIIIVKS